MSFRSPSPSTRLRVAARADIGLRHSTNEDTFLVADLGTPFVERASLPTRAEEEGERRLTAGITPPDPLAASLEGTGAALAVIDGMGGCGVGHVAARIAADTFAASLTAAPPVGEGACRARLAAAMNAASRAILEAVASGPSFFTGMGAAAVLALITGDRLHVVSAGDSRLYLLRMDRLTPLTRDDSLVNDYVAHGGLDRDLSEIPTGVITKALGIQETVVVQPSTFELRAGDVVLLCTDGLHDGADEVAITRLLLDLPDPAEAAQALVHLANRNGRKDDIAVVVARPEGNHLRLPGPSDVLESRNVP